MFRQFLLLPVYHYRIAGNFCGVFISAILRFLSATAELKTAEYFFHYYFISGHPYVGGDMTWDSISYVLLQ